ncbi:NAD(P)/FAD-dependent oxidoreductase [Rossellomorea marisflavi]|uniref:NAD(P)/FAD-dependent oxidoreductase n=1 Tax=Rossellomorea marisflavi TaxID=189381 RepID=UPI001EE354F7|nr:NAD(P)/FAD-dependent oxidoreductase [Rossellomorea marisflavi]UKS65434.1 NAD(P)/FAD-dependent oxidoreductase [Rossellomorea marisflavi]
MENEWYDVTIIGGGPVGLFSAFYAGMREMKVKIIESLPELGGQLASLYPEKDIYDIAGFPSIPAGELVEQLKKQALQFDTEVVLGQEVKEIVKRKDNLFRLCTHTGEEHLSRTVIITAGRGAFQPRKLEGGERFEGRNLHYHIPDLMRFKGKRVLLSGGGDSAVDWANLLDRHASSVLLVHRRDSFRAHEHSVDKLMKSGVEVLTPYAISGLAGDEKIESVTLDHLRGETGRSEKVDEVVVNHGVMASLGPVKQWGLELDRNAIVVNTRMETSIPGIYAAGDIATYPGKVKLIATGFGEGPTAVNHAKAFVDSGANIQPKHSTSLFSK